MQTNIYTFTELPGFLQSLKDENPSLSYDALSQKLHLKSRTMAKKIFKGQTAFPKSLVDSFCEVFNLDFDQKNYFELLRAFSFSSKSDNVVALYQKMLFERNKHLKITYSELTESELKIVEKWYLLPLLYYFRLKGSRHDPWEIRKDFSSQISEEDIIQGVENLKNLGFVREENGKLMSTEKEIVLFDGLPRALVRNFHESMIERALKSVQHQDVDQRYLLSASLNLRSKDIPLAKERIESFFKSLNEEFCFNPDADEVRQLNIQFFSLAKCG
jgi:uncharacterized protein (TIGR02147 family)